MTLSPELKKLLTDLFWATEWNGIKPPISRVQLRISDYDDMNPDPTLGRLNRHAYYPGVRVHWSFEHHGRVYDRLTTSISYNHEILRQCVIHAANLCVFEYATIISQT